MTYQLAFRLSLLAILSMITVLSLIAALCLGTIGFDFHYALLQKVIFTIRLPRVLSAFITGGLLALAGALMQVLLRNPLADPYVLGVSGGAAMGTLLLMLVGVSGYLLTGGAWLGSLFAVGLMFLFVSPKKMHRSEYLLLTGVAIASIFSAIMSLILLCSSDQQLRSMLLWLIGDLSYAHLPRVEAFILIIGLIISFSWAKELNILARGEKEAESLGISVNRLQIQLFPLSSLLTATAVTLAGCIGFIGLIVPHIWRLVAGSDHKFLLPGCVLLGGTFLTIADTLSRTFLDPLQLPVGIIMIVLGAPCFLLLLRKSNHHKFPHRLTMNFSILKEREVDKNCLLHIQNLSIQIGNKLICRDLNLKINPGEIWGILGPNGCGKTTLLHTLAGLRVPSQGFIFLKQKKLNTWNKKIIAQKIGVLFQDSFTDFAQTVEEYCRQGRYPHLAAFARENKQDLDLVNQSLELMELDPKQNILTLSGGEKRRLAIATLLTQTPELYLLDEPTNHLDLRYQVRVLSHFKKQTAASVIMTLHDVNLARTYCDKILMIFPSGKVLQGSREEILTAENIATLYDIIETF